MEREDVHKFNCERCGCVFKADRDSYEREVDGFGDPFYLTYCPNCGHPIYEVG